MTDGVPIGKVPEEAEEGRTKRQGDERKPTCGQGVGEPRYRDKEIWKVRGEKRR